jgi:hypothetical protein
MTRYSAIIIPPKDDLYLFAMPGDFRRRWALISFIIRALAICKCFRGQDFPARKGGIPGRGGGMDFSRADPDELKAAGMKNAPALAGRGYRAEPIRVIS